MEQIYFWQPYLVEVLKADTDEVIKSFDVLGYWEGTGLIDELKDELGLDKYSFMLSKEEQCNEN